MNLIGITGQIGSGKSETGDILKSLGFVVFDMDVWCRNMYFNPSFLIKIKQTFPYSFIKDNFHKKILREKVFSDLKELQKLEALTHPYLIQKFLKTIHNFRFSPYPFFIETALLYKMNLAKYCQKVIITTAPYKIIKQRVIKRDGILSCNLDDILKHQENIRDDNIINNIILNTDVSLSVLRANIIKIIEKDILC